MCLIYLQASTPGCKALPTVKRKEKKEKKKKKSHFSVKDQLKKLRPYICFITRKRAVTLESTAVCHNPLL